MRLLTAIPLLFWASTTAMAQLAVLWASEPAAAVTHAAAQDSLVDTSPDGSLCAHFSPAPVHPAVAIEVVPVFPERTHQAQPLQPEPGLSLQERILASSRLLANPPPFGV